MRKTEIESQVLEKIKPTKEESKKILTITKNLEDLVSDYLSKNKIDAEVKSVGSVAKGTFLKNPDIDLFILFPEDIDKEKMTKVGLKIGEELINGKRMYLEHPYTRGTFQGLDVDMVPCYHIKSTEKLMTAVDRTPFHTEYVLSKINEKLCDQIRLMKQFMKGIGTYGAEPNTRGFSGYACELLVIKYGGFVDALLAAAEWKKGITISLDNKKGPQKVEPIVLYDPVDPKRNVTSAVHEDTLSEFIVASKAYLRNPSLKFFFPEKRKPLSEKELRKTTALHGSRVVTVEFERPEANEDNVYSQIWKTQYALAKKLDSFSFNVLRSVHMMDDEKILISFEIERDVLSKTYKHIGPPVWVNNSETFLMKWKDNPYGSPYIEDGHWTVIAERQYSTAAEMIGEEAAISGIGREIEPESMKVLNHDESFEHLDILTDLLEPKHPWEI